MDSQNVPKGRGAGWVWLLRRRIYQNGSESFPAYTQHEVCCTCLEKIIHECTNVLVSVLLSEDALQGRQ